MAKPAKLPSPLPIAAELQWGGWALHAMIAAIDLDVFSRIASGKSTAREIAADAGANERAMRRLLDALVGMKHLSRKGEKYALSPAAATYLVASSDLHMDGIANLARASGVFWSQLADVVRSGRPGAGMGQSPAQIGQFFASLVKAIFPANFAAAKSAVAALGAGARRLNSILDVAAGAAAWSIPFAQASPKARVTAADLPEVLPVTREYAAKFGLANRFDYLEGNIREIDFGRDRFDLIVHGHIIHSEGAQRGRRLIEKSFAALREKGMLLIAEFIPNDARTGPQLPLLFGLQMMLADPDGDVFTMRDYREWLKSAGFKTIRSIRTTAAPSPLILATR